MLKDFLPSLKVFLKERWLIVWILFVALALRLVNIGNEPYWGDEVLSLDIAKYSTSVPEMVQYLRLVEFHPPLYYLIIRPVVLWLGDWQGTVRFVSLIFSVANVWVVWLLGRRLFPGTRAGIVAAGLMAVLPIQIEFGQEARPYAMFCLMLTVALYALVRAGDETSARRRNWWLVGYGVATLAALYLHYSAIFSILAVSSWWFLVAAGALPAPASWRQRPGIVPFGVTHGAIALLSYFALEQLLYKVVLGSVSLGDHGRNLMAYRPPYQFLSFMQALVWTTKAEAVEQIATVTVGLTVTVLLAAAVAVLRRPIDPERQRGSLATHVMLVWVAAATVVLFVASPQSQSYTDILARHVLFGSVALSLLIGSLITALPTRKGAAVAGLLIASLVPFAVPVLDNDGKLDPQFSLESVGDFISQHYNRPNDVTIVSSSIVRSDLTHFLPEDIIVESLLPIEYFGNDPLATRHMLGIGENEAQIRIPIPSKHELTLKYERIIARHDARRVCIFGLTDKDERYMAFFNDSEEWRRSFRHLGEAFLVDCFVKR